MYGIGVLHSRVFRCSFRLYSKDSSKKLLEFLAKMPKVNTPRINDAQRQRKNITKKSDRYPPSNVYLQVIGSGARGAPNTLYLFTDQKRYLFNCGECTQRLSHEHKVKLSRLDHIFITGKSWKNIGGLPGLSLTLQDVGVPNITLHGPEGLDELYNATKRFVIMKEMNVTMAKCTPNEDFDDNALNVKYVLLGPHDSIIPNLKTAVKKPKSESPDKEFEEFVHDDTDYYKRDIQNSDSKKAKDKAKPKSPVGIDHQKKKTEKVLHDLQKKSHCTVAYICTLKKRMGTLDLAKCVERGVKPGPLLGQLKNGQDVVLPDGTLVLSRDVKTPDDPGPVFIVMEVPELSYLKQSEFSAHFDNEENPPENIPAIVVHYTPPNVFNHPTYREFMAMFGPTTRHLVLNSQNSCLGSEAVHRTQHKLHLLDAEIFPMLRDASVPAVWNSHPAPANDSPARRGLEELKNKIALAQFQNIINLEGSKGDGQPCKEEDGPKLEIITGRTLTMFHLRPKIQIDKSAEPKLHIQDYIQETMDMDGFVSSLEQFRHLIDNVRYAKSDSHNEYPKVVFLGTGSCIPSKTRNTSGIALLLDEKRSMILDCGEGTFGQLVRFFGPKKVNAFLMTVKAIYISHLHADHHIGLIGVLQARREAFESSGLAAEPVQLLAPGQILTWLTMYDQQFERLKPEFTLVPNQNLVEDEVANNTDMTTAVLASLGVQKVRTCLVSHCPNAFGVAIQVDDTHKITYSGDTIPCESLVALGENSTLLIHEATMEDELAEEARTKMHSTTSQAIDIGRQMHAKYTLLTHFSQRYARLPRLNPHILNDNKSVGIAFDNMQITMSDLELLPHMYAPLQLMFAEHCVEMELKAAHRARHKERQERGRTAHDLPSSDNQSPNRSRKVSPGCRSINSAPAPQARYRESNASRLRQELKGMTISGIVKNGPRSRTASPLQRSANSSPTRSLNGDGLIPRKRDSDKTIDLISTPRTISETSSTIRETDNKYKVTASVPCGYIVDTRSKTLNTVYPSSPEKEASITKKSIITPYFANVPVPIRMNVTSGYGKPLVTHINKKLAIRRDFPVQDFAPTNGRSPILCRAKSPANSWQATKETSSANSLKASNTSPNVRRDRILGGVTAYPGPKRPSSSSTIPRPNRSPTKEAKSIDKPKPLEKNKPIPVSRLKPQKAEQKGEKGPIQSSPPPKPSKIPMSLRNSSTEKLKQQFCRDTPVFASGRPNSIIHGSTRSFKPQLEDIKSSYLLLNKKNEIPKATVENEKMLPPLPKPKVIDENQRKDCLEAVKKKFQSRSFKADARYDKIEGLNWISWK